MSDEHIKGLYPFLEGKKTDPHELNKALCSSVTKKSLDHLTVQKEFFEHHEQEIVNTAMTIADIYQNNGRLFVMGNGGSSCDASHIAVEFLHPITTGRPALTAIDLTSDRTMMTAIGNDIGFDHILFLFCLLLGCVFGQLKNFPAKFNKGSLYKNIFNLIKK